MFDFLFAYGGYTPHGFCLAWDPRVLWTHIVSDAVVALSYFSIPAVLLVLVRKQRDPALNGVATLFSAFILLCGVTHVMGIVTLYVPVYGLQAVLKAATAVVSAVTAALLWWFLPSLLKLPSRQRLATALTQQATEISERRKAEQAAASSQRVLARKIEELETANKELSELTYAASHDLKSPVTSLGLLLAMLEEEQAGRLDDDAHEQITTARRLTGRMQAMIEDLVDYCELLTDDRMMAPVDMNDLTREVLRDAADQIEEVGARVEVDTLPSVMGTRDHLAVLVRHMVENALTFRRAGEAPVLKISGAETAESVWIVFSDNGIGIDPKHTDKIFRLFRRLHRDDEIPGTGLGLALCRRVAALHGGTIEVHSSDMGGSSFVLTVPKSDQVEAERRGRRVRKSRSPFKSLDSPARS